MEKGHRQHVSYKVTNVNKAKLFCSYPYMSNSTKTVEVILETWKAKLISKGSSNKDNKGNNNSIVTNSNSYSNSAKCKLADLCR